MAELPNTAPQTTNRMDRRRARTRRALLEAGMSAIAELGLERLTISSITERADVALGSFYNHFDNREDFLLTLSRDAFTDWVDEVRRVRSAEFKHEADRMAVSFVVLVRRAAREPEWARFWAESLSRNAFDTTRELTAALAQIAARGCDEGSFHIEDPKAAAAMLLGLSRQCLLHVIVQDEPTVKQLERTFPSAALRLLGVAPETITTSVDNAMTATKE